MKEDILLNFVLRKLLNNVLGHPYVEDHIFLNLRYLL